MPASADLVVTLSAILPHKFHKPSPAWHNSSHQRRGVAQLVARHVRDVEVPEFESRHLDHTLIHSVNTRSRRISLVALQVLYGTTCCRAQLTTMRSRGSNRDLIAPYQLFLSSRGIEPKAAKKALRVHGPKLKKSLLACLSQ